MTEAGTDTNEETVTVVDGDGLVLTSNGRLVSAADVIEDGYPAAADDLIKARLLGLTVLVGGGGVGTC